MNSSERIAATLQGESVDRPPFTATLSLYGAALTGTPLHRYYTDPQAYVDGQVAVRETITPDLLFGPFALALLGHAFGTGLLFRDALPPRMARPAVASLGEAARLDPPDVDAHPSLVYLREATRRLAARYQGEVPVAACVLSPLDLPIMLVGFEAWMDALLSGDPAVEPVLDLCTRFFVRFGNALLADGAALLAFPGEFSHPGVLPIRLVRSRALPVLREAFQALQGPVILHSGALPLVPHLAEYLDLPNVPGFLLDRHESLADARAIVGDRPVLLGTLDGPTLEQETPEGVLANCRALLDDRAHDRRFILATSGADVSPGTPVQVLQALRDAACSRGCPP